MDGVPADARPQFGAPDSWVAPLARAIPAIVIALVITFSADHSARFGLAAFGTYAVVASAVLLASGLRADSAIRGVVLLQGAVTAAAGIAALVLPPGTSGLVFLVSGWAVITGALELVNGLRFRGSRLIARDWILTGSATLLLAVAILLVPQDFTDEFAAEDKGTVVSGVLTADVMFVGFIGAWAAIVGVQLVIAAITLRDARSARTETTVES